MILDSYLFNYLYNNQYFFIYIKAKNIKFVIAIKKVMQIKEVVIMSISLIDSKKNKLEEYTFGFNM